MSLVHNERTKLTAAALNAAAGSSFAVGVIAPIAAAFYNVSGSSGVSVQTIISGTIIWLAASIALHMAARRVLGSLKP